MFTRKLYIIIFILCFVGVSYASPQSELELGINYYEHGDYKNAVKILLEISYPMELAERENKINAYKYLGLSYFALAKKDETKKEFINLLRLDSDYKLDPLFINPETILFFENLKKEFKKTNEVEKTEKEVIEEKKGYKILGGFVGIGFLYNEFVGGFDIEGTNADINGGVGFDVFGGYRFPENVSLQGFMRFSSQHIDGNPNLANFTGFGGAVKYTWRLFKKLEQYISLGYIFQLLTIGNSDLKGNGITAGTGFEIPIHKFFVLAFPLNYTYTSFIKKETEAGIIGLLTDIHVHAITAGMTVYVRF